MDRIYVSTAHQQFHLRVAGNGPPLLLLHASPGSSEMMVPFMELLAPHFLVIAPDTPGYGLSAGLTAQPNDLEDYIDHFKELIETLGLNKVAIYGSATGAQLAIRFGLKFPQLVSHLFLDNAAHFTDEQRDDIINSYFPDISPKLDGSHLATSWTMVRDLFMYFPWCFKEEKFRLSTPFPPVPVIHYFHKQYLQSGANYHLAYRCAFEHEKASYVQQLKIPTTLFYWEGSIVAPYIIQLMEFELGDHLKIESIPKDKTQRLPLMSRVIQQTYQDKPMEIIVDAFQKQNEGHFYLNFPNGKLHGIQNAGSHGQSVLLLHNPGSSATVAWEKSAKISTNRKLIALSLPGHGESDLFENVTSDLEQVEILHSAMALLGFDNYTVCPESENHKIADIFNREFGIPTTQLERVTHSRQANLFALNPDEYGMYLFQAWNYLKNRELYHDPLTKQYQRMDPDLSPEMLQLKLLEWLKCRKFTDDLVE